MLAVVTGGAGFLGSHLVDALVRRGDKVIILDNLSTGTVANIGGAIESGKVTFVYQDVSVDSASLIEAVEPVVKRGKIDRIYHLASPASPQAYGERPWETLAANALGTMSLIELAERHSARFLFTSTSEIYGDPLVHPQPESYFGNVNPIGERACYDESKRFGEAAVSVAVRSRQLDARIVRFFNCYGPRMSAADGRLIPALCEAAFANVPFPIHGTGLQTRSMTYVDDAIRLLIQVMETSFPELQPVNIGNDDERSVLEIARAFAAAAGVPFEVTYEPARPEDPQRRKPDMTIARSLGWKPEVHLERGLREFWSWRNEVISTQVLV